MNKPFITGSAAYGLFDNSTSDIDVVMMIGAANALRAKLKLQDIDTWDNDPAYKAPGYNFYFFGRKVNVIIAESELEYDAWRFATANLQDTYPIYSREMRVDAFKTLRQVWVDNNKPKKINIFRRFFGCIEWAYHNRFIN